MKTSTRFIGQIRPAIASDITSLTEMVKAFHEESGYYNLVGPFCWYSSWATIAEIVLMAKPGICLVAIDESTQPETRLGFILSVIYPVWFQKTHLTSHELAWWIRPDARHSGIGSMLYSRYEAELLERKISSSTMIALENLHPGPVGKFYKDNGYKLSEHLYHKRLSV